ncbi:MAG: enoyl-CoA hydratase [Gammaproteobacteria bacterium]|nr:enoyl-CoA hydratase [Gammaproteobacteria bacterium]
MSDHSAIDSSAPGESPLYFDVDSGVARVVLDRPKSINALSEEMLSALQSCLDDISRDRSIRAVILRSSGDHFCAGHNLKEMTARRADADGGKAYFVELFETCSALMKTIVRLPQPVIAEIRGVATAAGCQLVAACDLAVAADTAKFATSGVNIGLFCSTPMVALSRNVSRKHAMEMLLLGEFLPAERVAAMGLVNSVVPEDRVADEAERMARIIAGKSSAAVKIGKEAFYRQAEMTLDEAYQYAGWAMAENMMARDAEAGIGAFVTKQPMPDWTGE